MFKIAYVDTYNNYLCAPGESCGSCMYHPRPFFLFLRGPMSWSAFVVVVVITVVVVVVVLVAVEVVIADAVVVAS